MSLSIMLANVTTDTNFANKKHMAAVLTLILASKKASTILSPQMCLDHRLDTL